MRGAMANQIELYDSAFFKSWEAFADILEKTFDCPTSGGEEVTLVRQMRFSIAIGALGQLLEDLKQRELASEFHSLSRAFMDIAEGVIDPIFASQKKKKKKGRASDTTEQWLLRASVVVGIRFLLAGDLAEEATYKVVQKHKKGLAHLLRPGTQLKSSVKTWVESFEAARVTNELAVDAYKEGLEQLDLYKQGSLKEDLRLMGENHIQKAAERAASKLSRRS